MAQNMIVPEEMEVGPLASQLVAIPSVNPMGRSVSGECFYEARLTDFLDRLFRGCGLPVERHTVSSASGSAPLRENILTRVSGPTDPQREAPLLLFEVHQDAVPVEGMTIEPWSGEIQNGRVLGRGACDIKGGMASMISALWRLAQRPLDERPNLVLACTVNEEHGFSGAKNLVDLWESGTSQLLPRAPQAIIVAEPTLLDVVVTHKGTVRWKCHTHGRAAHSSNPDAGHNAVYDMARVLAAIEQCASSIALTNLKHPLLDTATLSVGTINGGLSVNTVPDLCTIEIDRRLLPDEDPFAARQSVIDFVSQQLSSGVHVEHDAPLLAAGGLADIHNRQLAAQLAEVIRRQGHDGHIIGVPYGTDAAQLSRSGLPTVVFGPGSVEQAHTADEWVSIDQLQAAADILFQFARDFAARPA